MNSNIENVEKMIIENLQNKIYFNMSISYSEFLNLYNPYKEIVSEEEFAKILGISYDNLIIMKYRGTRSKIKTSLLENKVSEERLSQIKETLKSQGLENATIDYDKFLQLYEQFKFEMSEPEFAQLIGISYTNWSNMKNANSRAIILKSTSKPISEERKDEIKQKIIKSGYANKLIGYEEFLQLFNQFKGEMIESDFAQLLGITYLNWNNLKTGKRKVRILKLNDENTVEEDKAIKSSSIHSIEEIKQQVEMQISESSTPIDVMQMCLQAGMKRNQTLKYCMDKFGLTKIELLKMITQCLQDKKTSKNAMEENRKNKDIGENKGSDNKCI